MMNVLLIFFSTLESPTTQSLVYVEVIKKNRYDTGVYIEQNVCDAAFVPGWDNANIGCGIVDTPI